jgi:hypothetical protein
MAGYNGLNGKQEVCTEFCKGETLEKKAYTKYVTP